MKEPIIKRKRSIPYERIQGKKIPPARENQYKQLIFKGYTPNEACTLVLRKNSKNMVDYLLSAHDRLTEQFASWQLVELTRKIDKVEKLHELLQCIDDLEASGFSLGLIKKVKRSRGFADLKGLKKYSATLLLSGISRADMVHIICNKGGLSNLKILWENQNILIMMGFSIEQLIACANTHGGGSKLMRLVYYYGSWMKQGLTREMMLAKVLEDDNEPLVLKSLNTQKEPQIAQNHPKLTENSLLPTYPENHYFQVQSLEISQERAAEYFRLLAADYLPFDAMTLINSENSATRIKFLLDLHDYLMKINCTHNQLVMLGLTDQGIEYLSRIVYSAGCLLGFGFELEELRTFSFMKEELTNFIIALDCIHYLLSNQFDPDFIGRIVKGPAGFAELKTLCGNCSYFIANNIKPVVIQELIERPGGLLRLSKLANPPESGGYTMQPAAWAPFDESESKISADAKEADIFDFFSEDFHQSPHTKPLFELGGRTFSEEIEFSLGDTCEPVSTVSSSIVSTGAIKQTFWETKAIDTTTSLNEWEKMYESDSSVTSFDPLSLF